MEAGLGIGELRAGDGSPESFRGTRPLTERAAQLVANSMMPAFAVYVTPTVQAIHLSQVRPEQDAVAVGRGRVDEPRNLVLSQDALRALPDLRQASPGSKRANGLKPITPSLTARVRHFLPGVGVVSAVRPAYFSSRRRRVSPVTRGNLGGGGSHGSRGHPHTRPTS